MSRQARADTAPEMALRRELHRRGLRYRVSTRLIGKPDLVFGRARVACFVDGERARPQEGGFYGGWITSEVAGPFKGEPGTLGW